MRVASIVTASLASAVFVVGCAYDRPYYTERYDPYSDYGRGDDPVYDPVAAPRVQREHLPGGGYVDHVYYPDGRRVSHVYDARGKRIDSDRSRRGRRLTGRLDRRDGHDRTAWDVVRNDPCRLEAYRRYAARHENPNKRAQFIQRLAREGCRL